MGVQRALAVFGVALIAAGVVVTLASGWQHARLVQALDRGLAPRARSSALTAGVAVFLALVGIAMAVYLISFRNPASIDSSPSPVVSMTPAAPNPAPANPTTTGNGISSLPSHHSVDRPSRV